MSETIFATSLLPSSGDVIAACIATLVLAALKYWFTSSITAVPKLFMLMRKRELKRIRRTRRNQYEVQRQLAKENAYFTAFLASASVSLGLLVLVSMIQPQQVKIALWVMLMIPILTFECLWLSQQMYVAELTKFAGRLPQRFRTVKQPLQVSSYRKRLQKQRRESNR